MKKKLIKLIPWFLSFFVIFVAVFQLIKPTKTHPGMWYIFDDVHIVRTNEMVTELTSGQFPVRYLGNLAFKRGYLLFNFYSPLVYYLSSALVFLGKSPLNAVKNVFQLAYLVAGTGMFFLVKNFFPKKWLLPIFASILLMSSPYFNYDTYVRGALGELWGFALMPWLFLSYEKIKTNQNNIYVVFFALIASLMIYTHAISAFIAIPFLIIKFLLDWKFTKKIKQQTFKSYLNSALIGFGISASYLLPMIFEKSQVKYSQVDFVVNGFKSGFVDLTEAFGLTTNKVPDLIPITIGKVVFYSLIFSLLVVINKLIIKKQKIKLRKEIIITAILLFLNTFIFSRLSTFIWENNPLLKMTQFPYRFMTLLTVLTILFISLSLSLIKNKILSVLIPVLIIILSLSSNKIFYQPKGFYFASEFETADDCATTTWQAEYLPEWTTDCVMKNSQEPEIRVINGEIEVTDSTFNSNNREITISTNGQNGVIQVDRYFYPGWIASYQEEKLNITPANDSGLINIELTNNQNKINLEFKNTPIRKVGDTITLLTIIFSIGLILQTLIKNINLKKAT